MKTGSSVSRRRSDRRGAVAVAIALLAVGCGGPSPRPETPATAAAQGTPLELALRLSDGEWLDVGDLRGRPALIVLVTTYDAVCQALMVPLGRIARRHPEVPIVGVLAQAEAARLVEAYVEALHPPFPIGHEVDGRLLRGETGIGPIEAVPLIVSLDREGRIVERHIGFAGEGDIEAILERAGARGATGTATPPPLMGAERTRER